VKKKKKGGGGRKNGGSPRGTISNLLTIFRINKRTCNQEGKRRKKREGEGKKRTKPLINHFLLNLNAQTRGEGKK